MKNDIEVKQIVAPVFHFKSFTVTTTSLEYHTEDVEEIRPRVRCTLVTPEAMTTRSRHCVPSRACSDRSTRESFFNENSFGGHRKSRGKFEPRISESPFIPGMKLLASVYTVYNPQARWTNKLCWTIHICSYQRWNSKLESPRCLNTRTAVWIKMTHSWILLLQWS